MLQNKYQTMQYFQSLNICNIPETKIVNTVDEFKNVYKNMHQKYEKLCIKFNVDEGGQSFKLISDRIPKLDRISENNGLIYSYDYIVSCLETVCKFDDLIVMPYLDGVEVSIDCLGLKKQLIAIPRYKLNNRITRIEMNEELIEITNKFYQNLQLEGPFNIQFKYDNDKLYLLEINTRLSGGSWKAKHIGIKFPILCIEKELGILKEFPKPIMKKLELINIESVVKRVL